MYGGKKIFTHLKKKKKKILKICDIFTNKKMDHVQSKFAK